jgi:hypothetical protein
MLAGVRTVADLLGFLLKHHVYDFQSVYSLKTEKPE